MHIAIPLHRLASLMKTAIRADAACRDPRFIYGAMRFLFCPMHDDAVPFLGFCEETRGVDVYYPIREGGLVVLPANYWGNSEREVDCYGCAGLKIVGCKYALEKGHGYYSSDCPDDAVTWGRENDSGGVAYEISERLNGLCSHSFLQIFVAVDGGSGRADELCALAAGSAIRQFVRQLGQDNPTRTFVLDGPQKRE